MRKNLLKMLAITICLSLLLCSNVFASSWQTESNPYEMEKVIINGETYYIETVISSPDYSDIKENVTRGTITRTKTSNLYNSAGQVMIAVSVTGTFTYNGSSATCTSCSGNSTSYNSAWQIYDYYVSRSGNSATNYTTAKQTIYNEVYTYYKNVTITCSADGTIS